MLSKKLCGFKLVIKVSTTDTKIPSTDRLVTKAQYDLRKQSIEKKIKDVDKKIPNSSGLVKKTDYNTFIAEI